MRQNPKIILLGFGTIGKCVYDILTTDTLFLSSKLGFDPSLSDIIVVDGKIDPSESTTRMQHRRTRFVESKLKKKTLVSFFSELQLSPNDIVIDLTSCTGTRDIIKVVSVQMGARYLCTALEGWNGWMYHMPQMVSHTESLKKYLPNGSPTVLVTHGMNPGMVSHFALLALDRLSKSEKSQVKSIHITEIDTQFIKGNMQDNIKGNIKTAVPNLTVTRPNMPRDIISTWGPQNFVDEMNATPMYVENGRVAKGKQRAYRTNVPSVIWDPIKKQLINYNGNIVTHEESFTLNNYLKTKGIHSDVAFIYTPTKMSYDSFIAPGGNYGKGCRKGLLLKGPDVVGYDTVGIYLQTHTNRKIWIGNACSAGFAVNDSVRQRYHNATTMQVAAGVLSALFIMSNAPRLGFRFPEEIPAKYRHDLLRFSTRYYGNILIMDSHGQNSRI